MRTIIAQCTPVGSGALAVLRLSGPASFTIADQIGRLASGLLLRDQPANTVHYGRIVADTETVDQVLFTIFRAPKSFTGEDTVEIGCHNNQLIIAKIISLALQAGASLAERGEFSQQALLNRKLDLTQVEALNELIHAQTAAALKKSLAQLQGSLSQWLAKIEQQLLQALVLTEASFEFLDEEIEFKTEIQQLLTQITVTLTQLQQQFGPDQQLRTGIKIALVGPPNAGKSSLFNALLQQERAIVTEQPGTTRDTIEAGITCGDYWVTFVDTAGLRATDQAIEQLGISRSWNAAQAADLILLVTDSTRPLTATEITDYQALITKYETKIIQVANKCDLTPAQPVTANTAVTTSKTPGLTPTNPLASSASLAYEQTIAHISVSARQNINLSALTALISTKLQQLLQHSAAPFLVNQRHQTVINELLIQLPIMSEQVTTDLPPYELLALNLKQALRTLAELSGKTISETAMDQIFREFCVGK